MRYRSALAQAPRFASAVSALFRPWSAHAIRCARLGDAAEQQQMRRKTGGRMSMPRSAATGAMTLLTEFDDTTGQEVRSLKLEPAADGKAVLLIEIDERKPGIHREVRYEITPAELIAAIRAHGAELPGEQHSR
jgi:hypothetical protein